MAERWGVRRIDPMDIVVYGAAGFAIYYILKMVADLGKAAKDKLAAAAEATKEAAGKAVSFGLDDLLAIKISQIISQYTISGPMHVPGGVVFKNGAYVSWDAIIKAGSQLSSNSTFDWQAMRYKVIGRRKDGNYAAVPV